MSPHKDAFNLVTGAVVGVVVGAVVKGGAKALGAIGRTIKNSKPGKALANTIQKVPKIFNGKNADKVDDFARGLSRNTNKVADDVAEGVVKKSNKTDDVLYDEISNTVYHFEYARKAMENLPAIPK